MDPKKRTLNSASVPVVLRVLILFAAICSIGFPVLVSLRSLNNQMMGFNFAVIVASLFAGCLFLLFGIQHLFYKGAIESSTSSFASISITFIKFRWLICVLITAVVFLISNHLLARGLAVGIWDADSAFYPYQVLVADFARAGRFIHWDPWSAAGLPLSGDPQVGAFSPVSLAIGFLTGGTSSGFKVYWLLTWLLGGFGIIMLARHLKAPAWGGCVVALGFLFCGAYTGNAQHTCFIAAFSFLTVIIWRLDVSLCSRKIWPSVEAGALWGLSALAGYPGLTIITGLFCAFWAIGRCFLSNESLAAHHSSDAAESAIETSTRKVQVAPSSPGACILRWPRCSFANVFCLPL